MIAAMPCECDVEGVLSEAEAQASKLIQDNPALSMFVVFGVGVAVGALLGEVIACASMPSRSESMADRFGRQVTHAMGYRS